MSDLDEQVKQEAKEIENAPKIPLAQLQPRSTGQAGRCSWCGRMAKNLVYVDTVHGQERYKGECCGARHSN